MRITSKGQVTIPVEIREAVGLLPGTEVDFELDGDHMRTCGHDIPRARPAGQAIVRRLRGGATVKLSTNEIMALTPGEE